MKLLLDENLSYRIVSALQDTYPDSTQVRLVGLERVDDHSIWQLAKKNDYVIVTKNDDFHVISEQRFPRIPATNLPTITRAGCSGSW